MENEKKSSVLSVAILAGGRSRRMGQNKALLRLEDKTMIEHVVHAAQKVAGDLMLITNSPQEYAFLRLPMHRDIVADIGPLGGIFTALQQCKTSHCLVLACDLPFLNESVLRLLVEKIAGADVVAADAGRGAEPLCAVYSSACQAVIRQQIERKEYKINSLLRAVNTRIVPIEAGPWLDNINTPEDFARAKLRVRGQRENRS